jgi:hypothetical protein
MPGRTNASRSGVICGCRARAGDCPFELRFQLVGRPHREVGIVDGHASRRRNGDRPVHRLESLREQGIVVVQPPPPFAVEAVGDVELRAPVTFGGVGARKRHSRFGELVFPEEGDPLVERLRIDAVGANGGREPADRLGARLRLRGVEPDDEGGVND